MPQLHSEEHTDHEPGQGRRTGMACELPDRSVADQLPTGGDPAQTGIGAAGSPLSEMNTRAIRIPARTKRLPTISRVSVAAHHHLLDRAHRFGPHGPDHSDRRVVLFVTMDRASSSFVE
ncbi:hypothetical protein W59_11176 [Rhodococcus opacus RKJ300 = JCM 13270]|uniref:Uncharacterized protein n=1 Tax=Rhodococcus opacus RKJ300 = JCM 13270 TaxID=1165867 RepID=I0WU18_RHOOP|nr:hypothetical protein W59_11176 [Rhodococcus opacus RKJ300 = JCM 13270]